jgi:ATP-dependent Clp protease adapter protein ClpS
VVVNAVGVWRVVIHNDQVNSFPVVVQLVHSLCGLPLDDALSVVAGVHHYGSAEVAVFPEPVAAEQLVVALQRSGIDASVRVG